MFDNVSAQRADGLWARPRLDLPFDVMMGLAAVVLVVLLLRVRRPAWEYVACLGLVVATASAARNGVWLLCVLVVVAAGGTGAVRSAAAGRTLRLQATVPLAVAASGVGGGASPGLCGGRRSWEPRPRWWRRSRMSPTVASCWRRRRSRSPSPSPACELWAGNPLDAFRHEDQAAYLDFLDGDDGALRAIRASDVVVAREGSAQADLVLDEPGFLVRACGDDWKCYVRSAG